MTWLDYAVLAVAAGSIGWGVWRGLVREVLSIFGWIIAFLAANLFAGPLGEAMPAAIPTPELRLICAYAAIFIGALVIASLLGLLFSRLVRAVGLGALDRLLGALFGAARAALVVLAAALLAGLTSAPRQPFWRDSISGPAMAQAALALRPWLPQTFVERLRYD